MYDFFSFIPTNNFGGFVLKFSCFILQQAKFKKVKKKVRKIRKKKMLTADDLLPLADEPSGQDLGSRRRRMVQESANIPGLDVPAIKEEPISDEEGGAILEEEDEEGVYD